MQLNYCLGSLWLPFTYAHFLLTTPASEITLDSFGLSESEKKNCRLLKLIHLAVFADEIQAGASSESRMYPHVSRVNILFYENSLSPQSLE